MIAAKYSIIVPLYNEEEVIRETYARLTKVMKTLEEPYEIIMINDGSSDRTKNIVEEICKVDKSIKLIDFSRNFGHQIAITAGMENCTGDAIVVIDADLQDPPEVILQMIEKYKSGYDVVYAVRKKRKGETIFKRATAALFYRFLRKMTNINIPVDTGDFRLISRPVCEAMKLLKEKNRFVRGLVSWVGFKQIGIEYVREERYAGVSKYPLKKMIKFSLDGITSFSTKPLRLSGFLGFIVAASGIIYAIYTVICRIFFNRAIAGWTTIVVLITVIGGINMICVGVAGEYIARIYDEVKNRPLYLIKDKINF